MEVNVPKNSNIFRTAKFKIRITLMPKNLKILISVDPEILIGLFLNKYSKSL